VPNNQDNNDQHKPDHNLEEWLQLPEDTDPDEPQESEPESDTQSNLLDELPEFHEIIDTSEIEEPEPDPDIESGPEEEESVIPSFEQVSLFDINELAGKEESGDPGETESASVDIIHTSDEDTPEDTLQEELLELNLNLSIEFGDTLTGINASTGVVGLILVTLGVLGWLFNPIVSFLSKSSPEENPLIILLAISTVFILTGIHFIYYWMIHRISNTVKAKELDRILLDRRITKPCLHLDAHLTGDTVGEEITENEFGIAVEDENRDELLWKCAHYNVELEGMPICAVCEKYEIDTARVARSERRLEDE
jgi:hypothetical protein